MSRVSALPVSLEAVSLAATTGSVRLLGLALSSLLIGLLIIRGLAANG
jgi:hypothetical protein